jgi:hypothetical protein
MDNPNILPVPPLLAEFVFLNGELFVESSDGASFVLLGLVSLELVCAAARLVVTIVVESLVGDDIKELGSPVADAPDVSVAVSPLVTVDPDPEIVVVFH